MRQTINNSGENNSFLNFYFNIKLQEKPIESSTYIFVES